MVKSPNAYTYSNSTGGSVSGNVMTLTLNAPGGSSIGVSHSDEPFELWMDGTFNGNFVNLIGHQLFRFVDKKDAFSKA